MSRAEFSALELGLLDGVMPLFESLPGGDGSLFSAGVYGGGGVVTVLVMWNDGVLYVKVANREE